MGVLQDNLVFGFRISLWWPIHIINPVDKTELSYTTNMSHLNKNVTSQKATSLIYKKLISNKSLTPESSQKKWLEDCSLPTNDNINWTVAYLLANKCTKSTKLIEFQFKFLHRRVPTNKFLFRIGLPDVETCSFCHTSPESIIHLFWSCRQTSRFWNKLTEW